MPKKHTFDRIDSKRSILITLQIAVVLLGLEGFRYFMEIFLREVLKLNEFLVYFTPLGIAILVLAFLIKNYSDDLHK